MTDCLLYIVGYSATSCWSPVALPLNCDNQNLSRHCQVFPGAQNHHWWRTTAVNCSAQHTTWGVVSERGYYPPERGMPDIPNSRLSTTWQFLPVVSYLTLCIFPLHSALPRIRSSVGSPSRVKVIGPVL